jgi:hypothetical protein
MDCLVGGASREERERGGAGGQENDQSTLYTCMYENNIMNPTKYCLKWEKRYKRGDKVNQSTLYICMEYHNETPLYN